MDWSENSGMSVERVQALLNREKNGYKFSIEEAKIIRDFLHNLALIELQYLKEIDNENSRYLCESQY